VLDLVLERDLLAELEQHRRSMCRSTARNLTRCHRTSCQALRRVRLEECICHRRQGCVGGSRTTTPSPGRQPNLLLLEPELDRHLRLVRDLVLGLNHRSMCRRTAHKLTLSERTNCPRRACQAQRHGPEVRRCYLHLVLGLDLEPPHRSMCRRSKRMFAATVSNNCKAQRRLHPEECTCHLHLVLALVPAREPHHRSMCPSIAHSLPVSRRTNSAAQRRVRPEVCTRLVLDLVLALDLLVEQEQHRRSMCRSTARNWTLTERTNC